MASKKKGGGILGVVWSIFALVVIAALLFSIARLNGIRTPSDVFDFLKGKSDETSQCASGSGWICNPFGGDGDSDDSSGGKGEGSNGGSGDKGEDAPKADTASLKTLDAIPTKDSDNTSFARADWRHWVGEPCNTREKFIKSSGKNVKPSGECGVASGEWTDAYTGEKYSDPSKMDLDQVIPLSYASSHGGGSWDKDLKTKFANDTSQLMLADPSSGRGDAGPAKWMPKSDKCGYAKKWVDTADKYSSRGLGLAKDDKAALKKTLETCG